MPELHAPADEGMLNTLYDTVDSRASRAVLQWQIPHRQDFQMLPGGEPAGGHRGSQAGKGEWPASSCVMQITKKT